MFDEKEKVYLNKFGKELKNPASNKYVLVYTENKGGSKPVNKPKDKMTLSKLAEMITARIDNLERNFNNRFDRIENRLDYIVSANNLKDLPKNKSK